MKKIIVIMFMFVSIFCIKEIYAQNLPYSETFETLTIKDNVIVVNAIDFVKESEIPQMLPRGFIYAFSVAKGRINESYLVVCLVIKEKKLVYMYRVRAIDIQLLIEKRITEDEFDQRVEFVTVPIKENGKEI